MEWNTYVVIIKIMSITKIRMLMPKYSFDFTGKWNILPLSVFPLDVLVYYGQKLLLRVPTSIQSWSKNIWSYSLLFWWALARSNFWYTDWLPKSAPHNNGRHVSNMFKRDRRWHILVSCSAIVKSDDSVYVPYLYSPWPECTVHWTTFIECVYLQSQCKSNLRSCLKHQWKKDGKSRS